MNNRTIGNAVEGFPEREALSKAIEQAQYEGQHVVIALHHEGKAIQVFGQLKRLAEDRPVKEIRVVNGRKSITFHGGGDISALTPSSRPRSADLLVHSVELTEDELATFMGRAAENNPGWGMISLGDLTAEQRAAKVKKAEEHAIAEAKAAKQAQRRTLVEAIRLADAFGRHVAIILPRHNAVRYLFRGVEELANPVRVHRARRTNGLEQIEFLSGGKIRFFGSTAQARGYSADVLVAAADFDESTLADLSYVIHPSEHKQVLLLGYRGRFWL